MERARYRLGHTKVAGHRFDYHAKPITILIGRFIAVAVIVAVQFVSAFYPPALIGFLVALIFLAPWLINRSLVFRLRNTSYRNVRFDFAPKYGPALFVFVLAPILVPLSLGWALPWVLKKSREYVYNNAAYGTARFSAEIPTGTLYKYFAYLWGLGLLYLVLVGSSIYLIEAGMDGGALNVIVVGAITIIQFGAVVAIFAYQVLVHNVAVSALTLEGGHRFESGIPILAYFWRTLSRGFLATVSVGLLLPWATIDLRRFVLDHTTLLANGDLDGFVGHQHDAGGAAAAECGSFEGITDGVLGGV